MKKRHENKFKMYNSVKTLLLESSDKVNSIRELNELSRIFERKCGELNANETTRKNVLKGKAVTKNKAREEAIIGCIAVAAALYSLGKRTHDHELIALSDIEKSTLDRSRDIELQNTFEKFYDHAEERIFQLPDFGVGLAELEEYLDLIDRFSRTFGKSQMGAVKRKVAGKKQHSLFNEADDILKRIDKYIRGMTFKEKEFVDHYFDARKIRHFGIRHKRDLRIPAIENSNLEIVKST